MNRLLVILLLALSGLTRLDPGRVQPGPACPACGTTQAPEATTPSPASGPSCHARVVPSDCPMSGGPCRCNAAPAPQPTPVPDTPLPSTERQPLVAIATAPTRITRVEVSLPEPQRPHVVRFSLLAGRTHNQVQAFLGVWQA